MYLVGVTHISRNSIHDAVSAIQSVQPGIVFLELDQVRCDALHLLKLVKGRSQPIRSLVILWLAGKVPYASGASGRSPQPVWWGRSKFIEGGLALTYL